jgi:superfamily II DNA or RNA helicase
MKRKVRPILELGYSKSKLYYHVNGVLAITAADEKRLQQEFTYRNKSASFQYQRMLKGGFWFKQRLRGQGYTQKQSEAKYQLELSNLKKKVVVCLAKKKKDYIEFPTGLKDRVIEMFKPKVIDKRNIPTGWTYPAVNGLAILRPYQNDQLNECLSNHQGTIESGTGTGKTVVIQELIRKLGLKTLVIVPSLSILDQTLERFQKYFGKGKVGQFGGGKKQIRDITLGCAPSIAKSKPSDWKDVDVLIFDECHHVACDTIEHICYSVLPDVYYRFGFTATPYRSDGADLAIEAAVFPIIKEYSLKQGIKDGFLAKPSFMMFKVKKTSSTYTREDKLTRLYQEHLIRNDFLNDKVVKQANLCLSQNQQVLILVKEKEHGHLLSHRIPGSVFVRTKESSRDLKKVKNPAPFVKVKDAVADFNSGKMRCLIGTSVIGEGTDIGPVNVLFILTGGVSKGSLLQNLGRGLRRTNTKTGLLVIDYFFDLTNTSGNKIAETLTRHSRARYNIYKQIEHVTIKA